jgi:2-C-methyl-D-erythritol 4-phosphate cytidylyltransferase
MNVAIVTVAHHDTDVERALTPVHGGALLTHTVRGLLGVPEISLVVVVAPQVCATASAEEAFSLALDGLDCRVVPGPLRRAFSAVEPDLSPDSVILLHDALRPFITAATIRDVIDAVRAGAPVVVPVLPMADTVKVTDTSQFITGTEDRARLRTAQTPIGYTLEAFRTAVQADGPELAAAMNAAAGGATTVPGHPDAMRVTSAFELSLAEAIAAAPAIEETL